MPLPQVIGPYQVVAELGRGAMGVVFEVADPGLPGRRLALKQILKDQCSPVALQRFTREAELLARIQHPNVLRVYACTLEPIAYIVTELVDGSDLLKLSERDALETDQSAEITAQLCDAVGALHSEGIIHRDLKPENAILRPDGTPVLLDFGLARELSAEGLTQTGQVLGTPAYMSPEQADASKDIDKRTDVYGLGAILYQLLAGRAPYLGESMVKLLYDVLEGEPDWDALRKRRAPDALIAIIQKAMEKQRELRYPSVEDLGQDLRRYLAGEEVEAQPKRQRPKALLIGVGLLVLAGLGGGGVLAFTNGARPEAKPTPSAKPSKGAERSEIAELTVQELRSDPVKRAQYTRRFIEGRDSPKARKEAIEILRQEPLLWERKVFKRLGKEDPAAGETERGALFLPKGAILTWYGGSNALVCVSLLEGSELWRLTLPNRNNAAALARNGESFLAFETPARAHRITRSATGWRTKPKSEPFTLVLEGDQGRSVQIASFGPAGKLVLGLGAGHSLPSALLIDDPGGDQPRARGLPEGCDHVYSVAWSEDGRVFLGGQSYSGTPTFGYDVSGPEPKVVFRSAGGVANKQITYGICLPGDDLVQAQLDSYLRRFPKLLVLGPGAQPTTDPFQKGEGIGAKSHPTQAVAALCTRDGEWVYSVSGAFRAHEVAVQVSNNEICVWRRVRKGSQDTFVLHGGPYNYPSAARRAILSADGDRLLLISVDGSLRLYDAWLLRQ
ncbi:MAG: serine/threonine protein kinase [Planctomycetes bacterium]|nr:serine/threonine protein kinase [Planctomycetota bacterium]